MKVSCPDCGHECKKDAGNAYECGYCGFVSEPVPSVETLQAWEAEGGCETPCGCWTEPDGSCEHGNHSWMLMQGLI